MFNQAEHMHGAWEVFCTGGYTKPYGGLKKTSKDNDKKYSKENVMALVKKAMYKQQK
jgi:hypothetical protein